MQPFAFQGAGYDVRGRILGANKSGVANEPKEVVQPSSVVATKCSYAIC